MTTGNEEPLHPEVVETPEAVGGEESFVTHPTKLIRIASMTRAMLDEVRQAPLDDAGRRRLLDVHQRTLAELEGVLSEDLREEFNDIFVPITSETPSESELRIAQAQLIGWLEGLFHGIQASLVSQQMATRAQLHQIQQPQVPPATGDNEELPGVYL
ncbi:MAG: bacterial proteasome activator family protein [Acidimicrobiia bacterium]|nr:bacterial proteasome activator family protein [Acidimicrobiia bacterium]